MNVVSAREGSDRRGALWPKSLSIGCWSGWATKILIHPGTTAGNSRC
ncbi:hypothetical protein [Acidithiobacillus sp.]